MPELTVAAAETLQARRAALLLHGLSPPQRRLVMAKLGAAETSRLEPMLGELARLGIPRELALGAESLAAPARASDVPAKESAPRELSTVERAAQLDAASVLRALETCAPDTIGHFLRSYAWPWKAQVLELLPEPRHTRALDNAQAQLPPLAPAALTFLCARLCLEAERPAVLPQIVAGIRADVPSQISGSSIADRFKRWVRWGR